MAEEHTLDIGIGSDERLELFLPLTSFPIFHYIMKHNASSRTNSLNRCIIKVTEFTEPDFRD